MKKRYEADLHATNNLSIDDAVRYFNVSASTVKKLARESGAKVKIGSLARYRKDILEEYINSMMDGKGA